MRFFVPRASIPTKSIQISPTKTKHPDSNVSFPYLGRLAPSPTGLLHLGHAATFLVAHDRARDRNGQLFLRVDDLDPQRSREQYVEAAKEDLHWLGLSWQAELRQSHRIDRYRQAMQQLIHGGRVYPCTCSRKDLQQATQAPHEDTDDEPVYRGRCRPRVPPDDHEIRTMQTQTNYRFRVCDGEIIRFNDEHFGPQQFLAGCTADADFGDFLVWRKDGLPSYQLASVIDDEDM